MLDGKIDLSALVNALDPKNHCGPLASPPPAQPENDVFIGLFTKPLHPFFDIFNQNPSQNHNQSNQQPSDLIEIDPPLKELEKQIASFSQIAVSAITGPASQVGEIISQAHAKITGDSQNLIQNLTTSIQDSENRTNVETLKKPCEKSENALSTIYSGGLTKSDSVVSDTNPHDSNSVVSNQASSSGLSFLQKLLSLGGSGSNKSGSQSFLGILLRKNSKSSSNESQSDLSASQLSDSNGFTNSQDIAKPSVAESLESIASNHVIFNLASVALSSIGDALMLSIKWLGSQISSLVSERNNQPQPKITTSKKETNNTLSSDPVFHGSIRDEKRWLIIKGWFNGNKYKKEIPISPLRLGTSYDWSSYLSSSIYSVRDSISNLGKRSSKKISTLSEEMTSRKESSNYSFTALGSGSGALYKYAKSGLRSVRSGIQSAGSSIAEISEYRSSSSWKDSFSWKDSLHEIDLSNLTRSASNSVSGASRSLRGVNLGRGISRASSWAGDVAHRGSKFIERHNTTNNSAIIYQASSNGMNYVQERASGLLSKIKSLNVGGSISIRR
jgi:hypothetical protein